MNTHYPPDRAKGWRLEPRSIAPINHGVESRSLLAIGKLDKMQIYINGKQTQITEPASMAMLLERLDLSDKRVAVEVNEELVTRSEYTEYRLRANDKVEIIHAVGGG